MFQVETELETLNRQFESAPPQHILRWAVATFGAKLAVVTSFQPTGIVTLHMLSQIAPQTVVLTLDTELLFPETYSLMDNLERHLQLNLVRIRPVQSVSEQAQSYGPKLWERNPDLCCNLRKTAPLKDALAEYDAWITGLRRDQSTGRSETPLFSWDTKHNNVKLSPLATWTEDMIWTYIRAYELPYNTLHDKNYPSIGCWPCTQPTASGSADKRAGRWSGHAKTECGIHVTGSQIKGDV